MVSIKLTLYLKKTNFVIFRPCQKPLPFLPAIYSNDRRTNTLTYLESKDYAKYLGVLIDYKLSWKNHIDSITLKLSKTIGLVSKIRHFVPFHTLVGIYNCLVVPYFRYGLIFILLGGQNGKTQLNKLLIPQKRALRFKWQVWSSHSFVPSCTDFIYSVSYNFYIKKIKILNVNHFQ